jgi:hypothetical protein
MSSMTSVAPRALWNAVMTPLMVCESAEIARASDGACTRNGCDQGELATAKTNSTAARLYRALEFIEDVEFVHLSRDVY